MGTGRGLLVRNAVDLARICLLSCTTGTGPGSVGSVQGFGGTTRQSCRIDAAHMLDMCDRCAMLNHNRSMDIKSGMCVMVMQRVLLHEFSVNSHDT